LDEGGRGGGEKKREIFGKEGKSIDSVLKEQGHAIPSEGKKGEESRPTFSGKEEGGKDGNPKSEGEKGAASLGGREGKKISIPKSGREGRLVKRKRENRFRLKKKRKAGR